MEIDLGLIQPARNAGELRAGCIRRRYAQVVRYHVGIPGCSRKESSEVPENYERGELLIDTAMELETNATKGLDEENTMRLERGVMHKDVIAKMAQIFRSGTNDIDAIDFVDMFLGNDEHLSPDDLNDLYVLENFRPALTNKNWRMDCGVAGYDNTFGLPPFFPTRLRFEDYIYRIWIQQEGIVAAHVDAAQHHTKSNYMRNPPASEVLNEEIANLLKRKIRESVAQIDELSVSFDCKGELTAADAEELWPTLVEICYFQKLRHGLPMIQLS